MSIRKLYLRGGKYLQRHGLKSSAKRIWRETQNKVLYNRDVIYCCDLLQRELGGHAIPEDFRIERFEKISEVPERLLRRIAEYYSEEVLKEYIQKRFDKGACLWCLKNDEDDVGYTWTLTGRAMTPFYFFPLMERDVYLFDALIFPELRGRGLNSLLLEQILKYYKNEGFHRAYLETREWNTAVKNFLLKTKFVKIGLARIRFRRGKCKVTWWY